MSSSPTRLANSSIKVTAAEHTRSGPAEAASQLAAFRKGIFLALTLNARRTQSRQRILPCARCLLHAHICHSEELRRHVRDSSVPELLILLLWDGRTGQHEEKLCGGDQTSTDPSVKSRKKATIAIHQRQGPSITPDICRLAQGTQQSHNVGRGRVTELRRAVETLSPLLCSAN